MRRREEMTVLHYLQRSNLYRKLIHGPHNEFASVFADRLLADQLSRQCTRRSLSLFRDLMDWHVGGGNRAGDLSEEHVSQFVEHRRQHWHMDRRDNATLRRLLSALRDKRLIAAAAPVEITEQQQIVEDFSAHIIDDRGLSHSASDRHALLARRFLQEIFPEGPCEFGILNPEIIIGYVEPCPRWRRGQRQSDVLEFARLSSLPASARAYCCSLGELRAIDPPLASCGAAHVPAAAEGPAG